MKSKEKGGFGGGGAFHKVCDARSVVASDTDSAAADVGGVRHDIQAANCASFDSSAPLQPIYEMQLF